MQWLPSALGAAVLIGFHYLLLRGASGRVGDALGALVLEGTATAGLLATFALTPRSTIPTTRLGLALAAASGLCITGVTLLLFHALRRGGPVASTGTLVLGGGVLLSAVLAPWIFGESFTVRRALGVGLGIASMLVLSSEGRS